MENIFLTNWNISTLGIHVSLYPRAVLIKLPGKYTAVSMKEKNPRYPNYIDLRVILPAPILQNKKRPCRASLSDRFLGFVSLCSWADNKSRSLADNLKRCREMNVLSDRAPVNICSNSGPSPFDDLRWLLCLYICNMLFWQCLGWFTAV